MYESYIQMTPNDLHMHLTHKLKLHPERVKFLKNEVAKRKEAIRTERITRRARRQAWLDLLQPLRYELNSARSGAKYISGHGDPNSLRQEAFAAYIEVLTTLLKKLELPSTVLANTPTQLAKEKNATGKGSPILNNGHHWTDWIPPNVKHAVVQAFEELPHIPKAKRKVPFPRTTPQAQFFRDKCRLFKRTLKELENAKAACRGYGTTDEKLQTIKRIEQAIKIIDALKDNEHVPATWHGLDF